MTIFIRMKKWKKRFDKRPPRIKWPALKREGNINRFQNIGSVEQLTRETEGDKRGGDELGGDGGGADGCRGGSMQKTDKDRCQPMDRGTRSRTQGDA